MRTTLNVLWAVAVLMIAATPVLARIPSTTVGGFEVIVDLEFNESARVPTKNALLNHEIRELAAKNSGEPIDFVVVLAESVGKAAAEELLEEQIAYTNAALYGDNIPYRVRQLGGVVTNVVTPTSDDETDLATACIKGQDVRRARGADFLVFIKKESGSMAFVAHGSPENACILMASPTADRTFAHEFGHMAVHALHDMNSALHEVGSPKHGHTWCEGSMTHRTIMSASICDGSTGGEEHPRFSNPLVEIDGHPTGVPGESNLVKVLKEELGAVAAFDHSNVEECIPADDTLCLNGGRFRIQAMYTDPESRSTGMAKSAALTADSGYFYFFSANNVEITLKVLNGCGINGSYWVFAAGMTNVEVKLMVTDTLTGEERVYQNPSDTLFLPIADIEAFACN